MQITLIKTLSGFKLAYNSDYELAKKIPLNEPIVYEWKKPRNLKFHKKFFALLNLVFENQEQYNNLDHLRKDLTISAGYYDLRLNIEGLEIREAKSISFAKMTDTEFSDYYNRIIDVVVKWLGIDKEDIIQNINQYF
jgi:hypothetical protein